MRGRPAISEQHAARSTVAVKGELPMPLAYRIAPPCAAALAVVSAALFNTPLVRAQTPAPTPPPAAPAVVPPVPASTPDQERLRLLLAKRFPGKVHMLPATLETTQWGWF